MHVAYFSCPLEHRLTTVLVFKRRLPLSWNHDVPCTIQISSQYHVRLTSRARVRSVVTPCFLRDDVAQSLQSCQLGPEQEHVEKGKPHDCRWKCLFAGKSGTRSAAQKYAAMSLGCFQGCAKNIYNALFDWRHDVRKATQSRTKRLDAGAPI